MRIAQMSSRRTRLQIGFDPRDPMVELNGRDENLNSRLKVPASRV